MSSVVVSPHLDDAALSAGRFIAAAHRVTVVTVLAGIPAEPLLSAYDQKCGFGSSFAAVTDRRSEDRRAMTVLAATPMHLDYLDGQYGQAPDRDAIVTHLAGLIAGYSRVLIPAGISHPDHTLVADCAFDAAVGHPGDLFIYEDLPSRILYPEHIFDRLAHYRESCQLDLVTLEQGHESVKAAAVHCYRSQLDALCGYERFCVTAPERFWKVTQ